MEREMKCFNFCSSLAEFNFFADPESAHVVLKKLELHPSKSTIVTWELCHAYFYIPWVRQHSYL
jgi:inosine-uridine nucleoside N-ribohydrolase